MDDSVLSKARRIIGRLRENGYEAYIVGGAVRDYCLNKSVTDVDIATAARPEEVEQVFQRTIPVGIEHGTVLVIAEGESFEITTFRTESDYEDFRHPKRVQFVGSLEKDLQRRDFTINAMALSEDGKVIDPFGGREDLKKQRIRTVGSPYERFQEDPLRMMRALRFMSTYGFFLDLKTKQAIGELAPYLKKISVERIRDEFIRLLAGKFRGKAFHAARDCQIFSYLPGLKDKEKEIGRFAEIPWVPLQENEEYWALFCLVVVFESLPPFLKKWRLSKREQKTIAKIVCTVRKINGNGWTRWDMYKLGRKMTTACERVRQAYKGNINVQLLSQVMQQYDNLVIQSRKELAVDGRDVLLTVKRKPGPWVEKALQEAEKAVLAGEIENKKEAILSWLKKRKQWLDQKS